MIMLLDGLFLFMYNLIEMVLIISLISCIYRVNFSNTFIFPAFIFPASYGLLVFCGGLDFLFVYMVYLEGT
jgi:hypothetical protein